MIYLELIVMLMVRFVLIKWLIIIMWIEIKWISFLKIISTKKIKQETKMTFWIQYIKSFSKKKKYCLFYLYTYTYFSSKNKKKNFCICKFWHIELFNNPKNNNNNKVKLISNYMGRGVHHSFYNKTKKSFIYFKLK